MTPPATVTTGRADPSGSGPDPAPEMLDRVQSAVTRIGAAAGAAAATVVFVAVVGGAVMWLRFRNAQLPADQAVALVPRADLVVVGLRLMVLPVAAAGLLSAAFMRWLRPWSLELVELERREQELRHELADHEQRPPDDDDELEAWRSRRIVLIEQLAGIEVECGQSHGIARPLARLAGSSPWPVRLIGGLVVVALVGCVPFTPGAFVWPVAAAALLRYHHCLCRACARRNGGRAPAALPRLRLAAAAMIAAAAVSVARQLDPPVQLPSVHVEALGGDLDGTLVTANDRVVVLAPTGSRSLHVFARKHVRTLVIGPPADRRAPRPSLLSHVLGGGAWAATPLDVWCGGEHYPWWKLGDACRTQPSVEPGMRVQEGALLVPVRCPARARDGCSGFVAATTVRAYSYADRAQPVRLGRSSFTVRAVTTGTIRVPLAARARAVLVADGRPVTVAVTLSRDLLGAAPVPGARRVATVPIAPPAPRRSPGRSGPRRDAAPTVRRAPINPEAVPPAPDAAVEPGAGV